MHKYNYAAFSSNVLDVVTNEQNSIGMACSDCQQHKITIIFDLIYHCAKLELMQLCLILYLFAKWEF